MVRGHSIGSRKARATAAAEGHNLLGFEGASRSPEPPAVEGLVFALIRGSAEIGVPDPRREARELP